MGKYALQVSGVDSGVERCVQAGWQVAGWLQGASQSSQGTGADGGQGRKEAQR